MNPGGARGGSGGLSWVKRTEVGWKPSWVSDVDPRAEPGRNEFRGGRTPIPRGTYRF